ncbi:MAG: hypothetical protein IPI65_00005 [Bacteroidetes bacterium]|nr:hypothetical protein [Bacteroidota bacterium]
MVTYCVVCRTGRVFDPVVDGEMMDFRCGWTFQCHV